MIILGCIHALLLAEATTQLVDIHGRTVQKWGAKGQRTPAVEKEGRPARGAPWFLPDGQLNDVVTRERQPQPSHSHGPRTDPAQTSRSYVCVHMNCLKQGTLHKSM